MGGLFLWVGPMGGLFLWVEPIGGLFLYYLKKVFPDTGWRTHTRGHRQLPLKVTSMNSTGAVKVCVVLLTPLLECLVISSSLVSAETVVEAEVVCGRCELVCGEEIDGDRDEWFSAASDRFYFFEVGWALLSPWLHACHIPIMLPSGIQRLHQGVL